MSELRCAALRSLSVLFPPTVRDNEFWRQKYPEVVADAANRALGRVWAKESDGRDATPFERAMQPYAADPFLGSVERRVLAPGDSALSLELPAAREAMELAGLAASDVDLVISSAFPADEVGVGNAVFLARELGITGAAWNLETACSGALVALQTAAALVEAGRHDNVLVVVSCTYSRVNDEDSTLSFNIGDGAAAFVVGASPTPGVLAGASVNTSETVGAIGYAIEPRPDEPVIRMHPTRGAGPVLRDSTELRVPQCTGKVLEASGLRLDDIDLFCCNTPTAWYADFFATKLGVDRERVMDVHPEYGNVGPVLWPAALHKAATAGRISQGDRVLLFSIGSVSSAAAAVLQWTDVGIGAPPAPGRAALSTD
ncbi:MAG: 3-oxoacyl-ACP synthase [Deltaproteobacteria bacterium]|nr:3-oxoacyl-ACP synthase [Deltaproteobacteria bacterium]